MTSKSDYTPEEWQLLLNVPPMVGTAVMVAGRSGLGSLKEAVALANGILAAKSEYEDNRLIQALNDARVKDGERSDVERMSSPYKGKQPDEIRAIAVEMCADVAQLLDEKSAPDESAGFKEWSLTVGEKVANAAKEGGFLGIGGERVSQEERRVLREVSDALRIA